MLAYFCKYVPEELFQAFGTNITCMEPHVTTFTQADASEYVLFFQSGSGRI